MTVQKPKIIRKEELISPDRLWSHLKPQQREKTLKTLQNVCRTLAQRQQQANRHDNK